MSPAFEEKDAARQWVWDALEEEGAARFPFPPHGRIPNFAGAVAAAERLARTERFRAARRIKVNPDAPQRYVRLRALEAGIVVYRPTPRLRSGFQRFDPARIPDDRLAEAASLSKGDRWAEDVPVEELPAMDLVVAGSVAVTRDGCRCGKGEGYSDLEYAVLRELGHPPSPVVTTVHPLQVVEALPRDPHDVPLAAIVTPEEVIEPDGAPEPPGGIDWERIGEERLEEMPVLRELRPGARSTG